MLKFVSFADDITKFLQGNELYVLINHFNTEQKKSTWLNCKVYFESN